MAKLRCAIHDIVFDGDKPTDCPQAKVNPLPGCEVKTETEKKEGE